MMSEAPKVGDDGLVSEPLPISAALQCLPMEVGGLKKHTVVYSCLDATGQCLAVGSEQGYVWAVDLSTSRLLRELNDFKGTVVAAVRLNLTHDHIAYGMADGTLRVESITKHTLKKYTIRKRDGHPVSALVWSQDGSCLYCGYASGRLLQFHYDFEEGAMEVTPVLECGSPVVQLSMSRQLLLISTLARTWLLETDSGRVTQVGTRERKPGNFGGCFSPLGGVAYLARPGLRVWTADGSGKVQMTSKFRDSLASNYLPSIPTHTWSTSPAQFSDSWQFSLVYPLLGRFIVTLQERTLWVLDPENIAVVGAMTVEHPITAVATSGSRIYILCGGVGRPLVRLSVHPAVVRAEAIASESRHQVEADSGKTVLKEKSEIKAVATESCRVDELTGASEIEVPSCEAPAGEREEKEQPKLDVRELSGSADATPAGKGESIELKALQSFPDKTPEEESELQQKPSTKPRSSPSTPELLLAGMKVELRELREMTVLKPALDKLSGLLYARIGGDKSRGAAGDDQSERDPESGRSSPLPKRDSTKLNHLKLHPDSMTPPLTPPPVDPQEQERRVRMAQALEDEGAELVVASDRSPKRKRKKRKASRKISSQSSSTSTSMERLTDIAENFPDSGPNFASPSDDVQDAVPRLLEPVARRLGTLVETASGVSDGREDSMSGAASSLPQPTTKQGSPHSKPVGRQGSPHSKPVGSNWLFTRTEDRPELEIQSVSQPDETTGDSEVEQLEAASREKGLLDLVEPAGAKPPSLLLDVVDGAVDDAEDLTPTTSVPKAPSTDREIPSELSDNPLYQDETSDTSPAVSQPSSRSQTAVGELSMTASSPVFRKPPSRQFPMESLGSLATYSYSSEWSSSVGESSIYRTSSYKYHPKLQAALRQSTPKCGTSVGTSRAEASIRVEASREPREGSADLSDSSHESEADGQLSMFDSVVEPDYYKLCGTLVQKSSRTPGGPGVAGAGRMAAEFPPLREHSDSLDSLLEQQQQGEVSQGADIWVPIPHPGRHPLQSVCMSEQLLWVVDTRGTVYHTTTESKGRDWQVTDKAMNEIASSPSGKIVWGIFRQNAYARLGIGMNPAGRTWRNVTKNTPLAHKVKQIAADETGVWAIRTDGQVLFRKGVSETTPHGKVWQEVGHPASFSYVACCNNIIWAINASGKVFIREGITPSSPSGKKWMDVKTPKLLAASITTSGVVWGVVHDNQLGFRCGVSQSRPTGKGPWWEVIIGALTHPSSPYNSLWQVMSTEGSQLLASVSSLITTPLGQQKLMAISASAKIGVCVLEAGSKLHACWRSATGYHYTPACKDGVFQLTPWKNVAVGSTGLWLVREDDQELYCLTVQDKLLRIECASSVDLMSASPTSLWVVSKDQVWSRQGMTAELPEGISWDYIELSTQLHDKKLRYIACGRRAVWCIDSNGVPYFRFGVHAREPGTGMSPAWVPVEENPHPLIQITVSPDDWLVWACDENFNVYARTGVTQDFPVGTSWQLVESERGKEVRATQGKVYALTPMGELLCRYGISEGNVQGNYWRRMPGKYVHIALGPSGLLWTLDEKGCVWKQECRGLVVSQQAEASREELEMSLVLDQTWEVV